MTCSYCHFNLSVHFSSIIDLSLSSSSNKHFSHKMHNSPPAHIQNDSICNRNPSLNTQSCNRRPKKNKIENKRFKSIIFSFSADTIVFSKKKLDPENLRYLPSKVAYNRPPTFNYVLTQLPKRPKK